MNGSIVVTDALTKRYGSHTAVDAVGMTVHAGEIYGFLGPNGAGKTTTLRMLVGLIRPTSGTATVLGGRPGDPAVTRRIGVLIEGPGFYPYLSGRDNLLVLARYRGCAAADVTEALRRVGLADRADDKFRTYSLGMKQRLGVAVALLGSPDLLILDEPTNGLDPAGMAEMRTLITGLAADGHTVVLSSHLLSEVQEICDRVGVISHGRLLTESTVTELRGAATLFVRAAPVELAYPAVRHVVGDHSALLTAAGIRVDADAATAPRIARAVVESGADLLELRTDEKSLEEAFFEMMEEAPAKSMPGSGRGDVPGPGRGDVPGPGRGDVPGSGSGSVPRPGNGNVPGSGSGGVQEPGRGIVPGSGSGSVPGSGSGSVPGWGSGSAAGSGRGGVPGSGSGSAAGSGREGVPGSGDGRGVGVRVEDASGTREGVA
ncbi:ATP-binding cassette domain-containing protein [Nocardia terpenica]|uniref:ATP-binding cassette domain-containing protein n=1 Tax=Nocardia terpenica TaxID=455432 RepID=A0A6G9YVW3_9NOCA|nr:ATP-binding cassette domain-containing protein [Nocardia terpenica]QIS17352.1 ATP-binding cassette domain-containing protein [Nocardia terpenica]